MKKVEIRTEDGTCPAYEFGAGPGVLMYMDGIGIRPALFEMGERLASAGYHVLLPDLFWRAGPYEPMDAKTTFSDPAKRATLFAKFMPAASVANVMRDTKAYLDFFGGGKVAVTGYCLGGRLALIAAGTYPERIAAAASYHGSNLANDAPESPHLLAPKMKARVYVAGAIEDANFPDSQKERLEKALTDAGVPHVVETYPARHGWVPTDTLAHDPAQAGRHWQTLTALLRQAL